MTKKIKEIKVKDKHFKMIETGIKPFLFLRGTTLQKKEIFKIVAADSGKEIVMEAENVLLLHTQTATTIMAGVAKTFA